MKLFRLFLVPLCASLCFAQAPNLKDAKVEELFRLTQIDKTLDQSLSMARSQVQTSTMQQLAGNDVTPKQREVMKDFQDKIFNLLADNLAWNKLKPDLLKLYSDSFTSDELDSCIAFYRTPAGQAMVQKTPKLMGDIMALTQQRMAGVQDELKRMIEDLQNQLKAVSEPESAPK